ncbi:KAP family P-loop NTPase fold protein [Burkholderia cepacia]|uniref:KAP family P-loop NTPase fold protein n=1 Tax=Burkholderia cepacia TaxID=292 RepID=UPI00158DF4AD|nr:P-loop NTPase fold protein [Burkholderia cepacia]MDN7897894.1 P-loop NTPase fold protein [Burkholderia cepacia]
MSQMESTRDGQPERQQHPDFSDDLESTGEQASSGEFVLSSSALDGGTSVDQRPPPSETMGDRTVELRGVSAKAGAGSPGFQTESVVSNSEGQGRSSPDTTSTSGMTAEAIAAAPTGPELTSARLGTDAPSSTDELGFLDYAKAIARFLTHSDSKPPLTVSIQAPWGGGKSSLMKMIQAELDASKRKKSSEAPATERPTAEPRLSVGEVKQALSHVNSGSEPALPKVPKSSDPVKQRVTVWFNAWKYESTSQVWAGLVDAILQQVPDRLTLKERERFWALLNVKRIGVDRIRQRFYEYVIGLALRTTIGCVRAAAWAIGTAVVVFGILRVTAWTVESLHSIFGWTTSFSTASFSGLGAFVVTKWNAARKKANEEPVGDVLKDLVDIPKYEEQLGFVHQVERDLKRVFESLPSDEGLVIFIDDLDRCTPTKVAAVLEAVNLFLAGDFQSCCFVIGMDTEMVAAALQVAHKDLVDKLPDGEATPLGWRFMDKFVQLPFVIPPLTNSNRSKLMFSLLGVPQKVGSEQAVTIEEGVETNAPGASFDEEVEQNLLLQRDSAAFITLATLGTALLSRNPRELKRFINLLRFNYFLRFSRSRQGLPVPPPETLAKWTVLSVRWPEHARWLRHVRERGMADDKLISCLPEREERDRWHNEPNHLLLLETLARRCTGGDNLPALRSPGVGYGEWREGLIDLYGFGSPPRRG